MNLAGDDLKRSSQSGGLYNVVVIDYELLF